MMRSIDHMFDLERARNSAAHAEQYRTARIAKTAAIADMIAAAMAKQLAIVSIVII
jgi:hypothetical protein